MPLPHLVMRTVPATPIRPAYRALCVATGACPEPEVIEIDGRRCYVTGDTRVSRLKQGRSSYSVVFVRFLDNGEAASLTGAVFARKAKAPRALPGDPT